MKFRSLVIGALISAWSINLAYNAYRFQMELNYRQEHPALSQLYDSRDQRYQELICCKEEIIQRRLDFWESTSPDPMTKPTYEVRYVPPGPKDQLLETEKPELEKCKRKREDALFTIDHRIEEIVDQNPDLKESRQRGIEALKRATMPVSWFL